MIIAPSILSADFASLGRDVLEIEKGGAEFVHIDVMDGSFVPNISIGLPVIKSIRKITNLTFDVHLMIENPSKYIEDFIEAGADLITFHYEAETHIDRTINLIKSFGKKVGIAINPSTPVSILKYIIPNVDMVLIMSVNPGFGGQKFIGYAKEKIKEVKEIADKVNPNLLIQVDGGIDTTNIKEVADCGANVFVAGSAAFKNNDIENNIKELLKEIK